MQPYLWCILFLSYISYDKKSLHRAMVHLELQSMVMHALEQNVKAGGV